ncbi:hypothetical protein Bb109J_c1978 [Bdellovibrio bacteriovorus]|uniref:hypothetical protein n=1 Tax=Bdellovibrio bacteriovorus TaxID=959 RepID=UPI00045C00E2|nr:hypothetical protein [Bdellovibrio bacteriovorus]AHZ84668.1 hypothetical protein EP01_06920 [Bdellovibrio bacteriovorus]BEV68558.1 hypothetical protein Bb109J_c1978 [Bdellovibrio bacteriovorus]
MKIPVFKGDSNELENMIGVAELQSGGLVVTLKPGHELSRSDFEATFGSIGYEILILVGATNEDLKISSARIITYLVDPQFNAFFKERVNILEKARALIRGVELSGYPFRLQGMVMEPLKDLKRLVELLERTK